MRNMVCWIIVALLTLQVSLMGIDTFEEKNNDFEEKNEQDVAFAGRQSSGMNGNTTEESTCFFSKWNNPADGLGGPVWESNGNYPMYSIVEWPANSGEFYQTQINSSGGSVEEGHWEGPCTCDEIAEYSGINWDATVNYNAWQIVLHNGSAWIAQDAGTMAGDEPVVGNDLWVQCTHDDSSPCDELVGMQNVGVWSSTVLVSEGEIYEYPANSGEFYMVAPLINNQTVGEPGVDLDAWDEDYCDCKDIWNDSGQPVWDSTIDYLQQAVVEWPAGSNLLYISYDHGVGVEPGSPDDYLWRSCDGQHPTGILCVDMYGYGGVPWMNTTLVTTGEIYEFPAGSGVFHAVAPGFSNQTVGAPGTDFQSWSKDSCSCEDIWEAASNPVWDSNTVYTVGALVEYPAGTGDIWMAIVSQTTTGVTPAQPFADGNQWEVCGGEELSGGPCGATSVGVWDNLSRVSTGEVYEYPAGSQNYYEVIIQGYVDQEVDSPTVDDDGVWSPVDCPCMETWVFNGEPVWDASVTYSPNSVVEWPAGSSMLYITSPAPGPGDEPGMDQEWQLCSSPEEPSETTPCAGLNIVGVWDSSMNVTSGEIYEYPVDSGTYYQVNAGSPFLSVSAPDIDMDVWSPIDCPCKETWVANGQPAWVANTAYQGNYVVEHPAGSGVLYIPLESGGVSIGAGEPGVDTHWVLCDGQPNQPSGNPCAGLNVSVWDNTTSGAVGDIYEYPANSNTYYQIIFTHEDANGGPNWVANPVEDGSADEFWVPYSCPCKETWAANGEPVWAANTAYPGNYVVEHPAGSGNLYIPLEPTGVSTGAGEPGVDTHWVLCNGNGANPGPCEGITTSGVWNSTTMVSVGDIYEYPVNSGMYYQVTQVDPNGMVSTAPGDDQDYEFWTPYTCPCKTTWVANGQPVWDDTISFYSGNYVVEWPANSGMLYLSEAGGITGAGEPGIDGHWIPCDGNPEVEPDLESVTDSLPSISALLTLLGLLGASAFVGRTRIE